MVINFIIGSKIIIFFLLTHENYFTEISEDFFNWNKEDDRNNGH